MVVSVCEVGVRNGLFVCFVLLLWLVLDVVVVRCFGVVLWSVMVLFFW